jgi:hypothetical protein
MVWFIRRYLKGVKNSGTSDVLSSEEEITVPEFVSYCHSQGVGKYILGQRGKGIRGFRKITDCIVEPMSLTGNWEPPTKVFAAEEVSVKKNIRLDELSDGDLLDLMGSMAESDVTSADDFQKFKTDLTSIHAELGRRGLSNAGESKAAETTALEAPTEVKQAMQPVAGAGFTVGKSGLAMGFVGGLLVGSIATMAYYKSKMDSINADLERINKQLNEAESAIKRAESREEKRQKAAETAVKNYDSRRTMDAEFLSNFNRNMGPTS